MVRPREPISNSSYKANFQFYKMYKNEESGKRHTRSNKTTGNATKSESRPIVVLLVVLLVMMTSIL